jgi:hypothetical protein
LADRRKLPGPGEINMNRNSMIAILATILLTTVSTAGLSQTGDGAAQSSSTATEGGHEAYSTDTPVGTLLDDPKAHAVLQELFPDALKANDNPMGRSMSLRQMQPYSPELTDSKLNEIDAALAKLNN